MIHSFDYCREKVKDSGRVAEIKGTLAMVEGFQAGKIGEVVVFEDETKGMIESINSHSAQVMLFSRELTRVGLKAVRGGNCLTVSVGKKILGHTITPLGYYLDQEKEVSRDSESEVIEVRAMGIDRRAKINKQLKTGVALVDLILPLGEGQRELLIGNKKTGKTDFCLKTMLTQARENKVCVYALIGKKQSDLEKIEQFMQKNGIEDKCILVAAVAGCSPGEIFLAPFTAMAVAEHFRDKGRESLVILDDLTTHAKYYREISLLSGNFPGRESYPGEIFYTHARLLERGGNFLIGNQPVSLTVLPVAETLAGDLTGYIQTNLMSMTDGHLFFDEDLFLQGRRPAINPFLSVTRVGKQTQTLLMQQLNGLTLKTLKKRQEAERYLRFGTEMTEKVLQMVNQGDKLRHFLNETDGGNGYNLYPFNLIITLVGLILADKWDGEGSLEWLERYKNDAKFRKTIDHIVEKSNDLKKFLAAIGSYEKLK